MGEQKGGSLDREREAMMAELQLPPIRIKSGQGIEIFPHLRQEEVDALAETDLLAAVDLARRIRLEDEQKQARHSAEGLRQKADQVEAGARYRREQAEQQRRNLETRRVIVTQLERLGVATDADQFLDAAEGLLEHLDDLTGNDLQMFGAQHEIMIVRSHWTADRLKRMKRLEPLIRKAAKQRKTDRYLEGQKAGLFADGERVPFETDLDADGDRPKASKVAPVNPPTWVENIFALFGRKPKR